MRIPSMLYGRAATVKSRARKAMKPLIGICNFESLDPGPFVETADVEGQLQVEPPRVTIHPETDHFHCYALTLAVLELTPWEKSGPTMEALLNWELCEPWRFLGTLGNLSTGVLDHNRSLLQPYVEVAVRFWPELTSVGNRYGSLLHLPHHVWWAMHSLRFALANLGIPAEDLRKPAPPGDPAEFLKRIDAVGTSP